MSGGKDGGYFVFLVGLYGGLELQARNFEGDALRKWRGLKVFGEHAHKCGWKPKLCVSVEPNQLVSIV